MIRHLAKRTAALGFTLIELLVALAIFAIMAAMSYPALSVLSESRARLAQASAERTQLSRALARLQTDLEWSLPRPRVGEAGLPEPALSAQAGGREIAFTRTAYSGVLGESPAPLPPQRLAYRLEGERLLLLHYPALDSPARASPVASTLIAKVQRWDYRFWDGTTWQASWPPYGTTQADTRIARLPVAIESSLTFTINGAEQTIVQLIAPIARSVGTLEAKP